MKNKCLKLLFIIMIAFVLLVVSIGCDSNNSTNDNKLVNNNYTQKNEEIKVKDYSIIEEFGTYYIIFDNISLYEDENESGINISQRAPGIDFKSIAEFKNTVTQGKLSTEQKKVLSKFKKTDDGKILMCNFDNIQEPILPEKVSVTGVTWSGMAYSCFLLGDTFSLGFVHYRSQDAFDRRYEKYVNRYENELITIKEQYIDDNQKMVTYFKTSTSYIKTIRFSLSDGNKTFFIDKDYVLKTLFEDSSSTSSNIPLSVTMFCMDGENNYEIEMYHFTEDPSDEWLMNFGTVKYEKSFSD